MRKSGGEQVVMCMSLAPFSNIARSNWFRLTLRPSSGFMVVGSRFVARLAVAERFGVGAPKLRGGALLDSLQRGGGEGPDEEAFVRVHFRVSAFNPPS